MQLPQAFDANQIDPTQSAGGQLPIGKHLVVVESSEVKATKDNSGGYIQLNLKITEGPSAGTTGAYRLNIYNSNQQAVEIAQKQLSAVCHVTGVFSVQDSSQLHNIPFMVEVGPQKNKPEYTEVKKVFDAAGNEPGKAPAAPAQPTAPATQGAPAGAQGAWGVPTQPALENGQVMQVTHEGKPVAPAQAQPWGAPQGQPAQAQPQQPGTAPAGNPPWGQPQG